MEEACILDHVVRLVTMLKVELVTENHLLVGAQNREMKILVHHPLKRRLTILIYLRITVLAIQLPKHQAAR